ncbi:MAG: YIP1 family protein [Actinomycetota bacterium]
MTPGSSDSAGTAGDGAHRRSRTATPGAARASVRLGLTLRSLLLSPREGFAASVEAADRRERAGERLPEGVATYVLTVVGGASLMLLWLKVGGLVGRRRVAAVDFEPGLFVSLLSLGALLGLFAVALWGAAGPWALRRLGAHTQGRDLRMVWGAAAFPQLLALLVLLPLDMAIVGPATFTTEQLTETLGAAWASISIALSLSLAAWSAFLFWRGLEVAAGLGRVRAVMAGSLALIPAALVTGAFVVAGKVAIGAWL